MLCDYVIIYSEKDVEMWGFFYKKILQIYIFS